MTEKKLPVGGIKKKSILLVGCGGDLGSTFVDRYADEFSIIGVSRAEPRNKNLLSHFIRADITWEFQRVVRETLQHTPLIDALVYNAVYYDLSPLIKKKIHRMSTEFQTNVIVPFTCAQELLLRHWIHNSPDENRQHNISITNIGSQSGVHCYPNIHQGTYSATKSALHMLSLHMAAEWQEYGIRTNTLAYSRLNGSPAALEKAASTLAEVLKGMQNGEIITT